MAKSQEKLLGFNGGVISPLALARQDLPRFSLFAEEQTNIMPRHMGSAMLRPGFGFTTPILPKYTNTTLTVNVGGAKTLASATGLANNATVYTATLTYGAFSVDISVVGSASQTYATLLAGIYTDMLADPLGGEAITVGLVDGNIVFEVQAHGDATAFALVNSGANSLFTATLTGFVAIGAAVLGEDDIESDSKLIDFIFSKDDTAKIALVDSRMRVLVSDAYIEPAESFTTAAINGHFLYTLNSWTDTDDAGCTSDFAAGTDGTGYMSLIGTGFNYARRNQQITVAGADEDKEHQCRIVIVRGVVELRIGTSAGDGTYVSTTLTKGTHYFSFSPTASFYVEFSSATKYASLVDSIYFHTGALLIETDYTEDVFPFIRHTQSGNVVYLAAQRIAPRKIFRTTTESFTAPTAAYCIVDVGGAKTGVSATGLANDSTLYGFSYSGTHSWSGGRIYITGSDVQTYTTLLAAINSIFATHGSPLTASIEGGNIKIAINATGPGHIEVFDYTTSIPSSFGLFSALTGFVEFETPVDGAASTALSANSWSLTDFLPEDGPFLHYNGTGITLVSSALTGDVTLTASKALFQSGHVGALFQIDSAGQKVESTLSGQDQWSNSIRVTGTTRAFFATRASIGTNTVTLQRSIDGESSWTDIATYTTNATTTVDDGLDNQIAYYRIGIKTGNYTSGSPVVTLAYSEGSISGICRIVAVASGTSATAIVLRDFGSTIATVDWREGAWSDYRGYPSAVDLAEGRLCWGGKQWLDASASDQYEVYDDTLEGAGRPIRRSIGFGSADNINWIVGGERLLLGTDTRILEAKSSNDGYPMTQDDFSLRVVTSQGSAKVNPVKVDKDVIYVQNSGVRLIRLAWDGAQYTPIDLTALSPEICEPAITRLAIQQQPDVRIHCVLSDGTTVVLLFDPVENLQAFIPIETDGDIEDVVIFPGSIEDQVYYVVKRTIPDAPFATDASVVRYLEKWALESECQGGTLNKQLDAFITYSGISATVFNSSNLPNLAYLEDEVIKVWGNGVYNGSYTVNNGAVTLATAVTSAVFGIAYSGTFKSVKLGRLMDKKIIPRVGLIMRNVHPLGIEIGMDFDNMRKIQKADYTQTAGVPDETLVIEDYHKETIAIDGKWTVDSRLCLRMTAPYCCTVLAAILDMEQN
jgi:hypothetical protein